MQPIGQVRLPLLLHETTGRPATASITRLTEQWQQEREAFERRDLSGADYVYAWVDGIHTKVRLGRDDRLCCLVVVGARLDGKKELVAVRYGYRESEGSWAELLRDLKKRGMRAPVLAVGDRALEVFWAAVRDVPRDPPPVGCPGTVVGDHRQSGASREVLEKKAGESEICAARG